jgi:hypothetical protein
MMIHRFIYSVVLVLITSSLFAQDKVDEVVLNGHIMTRIITEEGDTLFFSQLTEFQLTGVQNMNQEEKRLYRKYRRYALKVYPYALDAIKIFKEVEYATNNMSSRKRKKYIKKLSKDLKNEFEEPLRGLTRTQGLILMKMIEKELDTPMYDLIRDLRGKTSSFYWNMTGKIYGYDLKNGYVVGDDKIMDAVLQDFDISYKR